MMSFSPTKVLLSIAVMLTLSACGPGVPVLPDDPNNEPVAAAPDDSNNNGQGSVELPSVTPPAVVNPPPTATANTRAEILKLYDYVDPTHIVPTKKLEDVIIYFHQNKSKFQNQNVISVIDFSQKSTQKRWYFINLSNGSVWNVHVAHGKGSDSTHDGFAKTFSNVSGSNASSLGFYKTAETYQGSNGYSLRLDGLSSTNSNARSRAIVVHGAAYVQDSAVIQGRSWGCPAVSMANRDKVINLIKGGSLIYAAN